MGMFDREPNFGEAFKEGDRFVLTSAEYIGKIHTREGVAEKSSFTIVSKEHPQEEVRYSVLGIGFANQAKRAEGDDFPRVVEYITLPTGTGDNRVKLVAPVNVDPRAFLEGNNGPPLDKGITSIRGETDLGF
jgi:hypothetical protein